MKPLRSFLGALVALAALAPSLSAQAGADAAFEAARRVAEVRVDVDHLNVPYGETVPLPAITAVDAAGNPVEGAEFRVISSRNVRVTDDGLTGLSGGEGRLIVTLVTAPDFEGETPLVQVPLTVTWPSVARVDVERVGEAVPYAGTSVRFTAEGFHADGSVRPDPDFRWSTSDPSVASIDQRGHLTALRPGRVDVIAELDGGRGSVSVDVPAFPADRLELTGGRAQARTGDVLEYEAVARDASGRAIPDLPILWTVSFVPDDTIHAPGAAGLVDDGRFVGEVPGVYSVVATAGDLVARTSVDVRPRDVVREVQIMGQGSVDNVHTSDLWVYEGNDGRDYAVTGTWGGDGWSYFWDVTDPANPMKTDSLQIDARTVNDVKVSPDARYAVLGREGASSRRNGVVILDLSEPGHPTIASTYDEGLTGGVHNMFATEDHLFALSAGDKYVILDVTDLANPRYVSEYNHPDSRIHDVWVHDGVAYSSEWGTGVVVVDVGNGRWGGSIDNPVFVTNVPYPVGATHAAFPYHQEETGKFYLFLGDEIMARGGAAWSGAGLSRIPQQGGTPSVTSGYIHVIDFTDPENPEDVARYEVPEFGTHNMWVEDDLLYVAYYEGGVRVVDVSGELMGNLANQGREVAVFKAFDPEGYVANAPMAWGPQPHKGYLFFSDFNSGLWSIRLEPRSRPIS